MLHTHKTNINKVFIKFNFHIITSQVHDQQLRRWGAVEDIYIHTYSDIDMPTEKFTTD